MIYPKLSRFFEDSIVRFEHDLEGMDIDDESMSYVLGDRAASSCDIFNLCHEMAHFIDRDKDILKRFITNWGFSYGKYWQFGRGSGYEPRTGQSTQCEIRVFAYQYVLMKSIGVEVDPKYLASLVRHVNSFPVYCYERNMLEKTEKEKLAVVFQEMMAIVDKFTIDDFERLWWDRTEGLKKYLINNFKEKSITQ